MKYLILVFMVCVFLTSIDADLRKQSKKNKINRRQDNDDLGRVRIKVFRGPDDEVDGNQFAHWGYWVSQPRDDEIR